MPGLSPERLALLRRALASKGLGVPSAVPVARRVERDRAPLSPAQERLYFLEVFEPGTPRYNDAMAVDVEGPLDAQRLSTALARVVERHEVLRTTFVLSGTGPQQRIATDIQLPFVVEDLRASHEASAEAERRVRADARRPFDLEHDLPWRARLCRIGDERWLFACTMHHIVSDGASFGLLFDELGRTYSGATDGPLAVQFGDYACWEQARLDAPRESEDVAWWQDHLRAPLTELRWPDGAGRATGSGGFASLPFASDHGPRLGHFARQHGATTNQVLLATWLAFLGGSTGTTDVRTGLASSLRRRPELAALIGFFVETQCLRVDLAGDPTFLTFLERVREASLEAARREVPFDRVARAVGHEPLIQVFFSHMKDVVRAPDLAPARTSWRFLDPGVARFELSLVLHESAETLTGFLEHDSGSIASGTARELALAFTGLLEAVLTRPGARLSDLASSATRSTRSRPFLPLPPRRAIGG